MKRALLVALALLLVAAVLFVALRPPSPPAASDPAPIAAAGAPSAAPPKAPAIHPAVSDAAVSAATADASVAAPSSGQVVIRGAWGGAPGQFGRRREPESNPEAPMAIAAGPRGEVAIVDQQNRRVQRFRDGRLVGAIDTGGDTIQDLALRADGSMVLLDRLADRNVQLYDRDGKLLNEAPVEGKGIPEAGGTTGLFTDETGVWVEREHRTLVRVADPAGNVDRERPELPGRPTRDGKLILRAAIVDRAAGLLRVDAVDRASLRPLWSQPIQVEAPILHLLLLDSDRHGMVYVAAEVGRESPSPPYAIVDAAVAVARLGAGGAPRGMIAFPAAPSVDETFRPITIDDDGAIYAMVPGTAGLSVVRYLFP